MSVHPYQLNPATSMVLNATKLPAHSSLRLEQKHPVSQRIPQIETRRPCNVLKGVLKAIVATVPVVSLRAIAIFISIFGRKGEVLSAKIQYRAKKIQLIYITHHLVKIGYLRGPPLLCCSKNLGSKKSIRTEEDLQKSKEFVNRLLNPDFAVQKKLQPLSSDQISLIQSYRLEGAEKNGICYGISLFLIKILLSTSIHSEAELINFIKPYKKGFPAEATALQNAFRAFRLGTIAAEYQRQMNDISIYQAILLNNSDPNIESFMMGELRGLDRERHRLDQDLNFHNKMRREYMASLMDLKLNAVNVFTPIEEEETRAQFNQLPIGFHQFVFSIGEQNGHSLVYIKKEFGSYFVDPNYGLIKCKTSNPAQELSQFLKKYYPQAEKKFTLTYKLG